MRLIDVKEQIKEAVGACGDSSVIGRTVTTAVELLANKGLLDSLQGYLDIVAAGRTIALPREVKVPIRININGNPSFSRSRMFEFSQATGGTIEGDEVGFAWADRHYAVIQDETKLPDKVSYLVTDADDAGKTCTIKGRTADGVIRTETLVGATSTPTESTYTYVDLIRVVREATESEAFLQTSEGACARYYADEEEPKYRVIKLSKVADSVRILYKKHVPTISDDQDEIPIDSRMAIIQMCKAVRLMSEDKWDEAAKAEDNAIRFLREEQDSRDLGVTTGLLFDSQRVANLNISTREMIIVADIYDEAAQIFEQGIIGQKTLFDKITTAIEVLANKAQWDSLVGYADIWKSDTTEEENYSGKGNGFFVLPRDVERILALNVCGSPKEARNKWYEFHLNGSGERNYSSGCTWDDVGTVVTVNRLPIDPDTKKITPTTLYAQPASSEDDGTEVRIFGIEELSDGSWVEVYRDGVRGWLCPCVDGSESPGSNPPQFVRIDRITKAESTGFISLFRSDDVLMGYWEPDELEPNYQMIKVNSGRERRIRIRYRRRWRKISSLYDPIFIRSRIAILNMLRALKAQEAGNTSGAIEMENLAVQYIKDEQRAMDPVGRSGLQINRATSPLVSFNIS